MGRKLLLPHDIRQECLWIVRGYDRRVKVYHEVRRNVIAGTAQQFLDMRGKDGKEDQRVYLPHGSGTGRPNENKFGQLSAIEEWPETQKM